MQARFLALFARPRVRDRASLVIHRPVGGGMAGLTRSGVVAGHRATSTQDAVVDAYVLAHCGKIWGTSGSCSYLSMKLAFGPPIGSTELAKLSLIVSFLSLVTLWISTRMPYVHKSSTRLGKEMCTQMARVSLRTYPICLLEIWSLR